MDFDFEKPSEAQQLLDRLWEALYPLGSEEGSQEARRVFRRIIHKRSKEEILRELFKAVCTQLSVSDVAIFSTSEISRRLVTLFEKHDIEGVTTIAESMESLHEISRTYVRSLESCRYKTPDRGMSIETESSYSQQSAKWGEHSDRESCRSESGGYRSFSEPEEETKEECSHFSEKELEGEWVFKPIFPNKVVEQGHSLAFLRNRPEIPGADGEAEMAEKAAEEVKKETGDGQETPRFQREDRKRRSKATRRSKEQAFPKGKEETSFGAVPRGTSTLKRDSVKEIKANPPALKNRGFLENLLKKELESKQEVEENQKQIHERERQRKLKELEEQIRKLKIQQ